jgi:hypothetical protein
LFPINKSKTTIDNNIHDIFRFYFGSVDLDEGEKSAAVVKGNSIKFTLRWLYAAVLCIIFKKYISQTRK